jgi:hypothetical protein
MGTKEVAQAHLVNQRLSALGVGAIAVAGAAVVAWRGVATGIESALGVAG